MTFAPPPGDTSKWLIIFFNFFSIFLSIFFEEKKTYRYISENDANEK